VLKLFICVLRALKIVDGLATHKRELKRLERI